MINWGFWSGSYPHSRSQIALVFDILAVYQVGGLGPYKHQLRVLSVAAIAQLGERQTEDLKVPGSIPGLGI